MMEAYPLPVWVKGSKCTCAYASVQMQGSDAYLGGEYCCMGLWLLVEWGLELKGDKGLEGEEFSCKRTL